MPRAAASVARRLAHRVLGQMAGELQPLRLAARERRHRLAEAQVIEADVGERRAGAGSTSASSAKNSQRLGDREIEHVGDAQRRRSRSRGSLHSSISAR